jgi:hypothetical protein
MNLNALNEIVLNQENYLEQSAEELGLDFGAVRAAALIVNDKGIDKLKGRQVWIFNNAVRPLIENVQCEGYRGPFGEDENDCQNMIDDAELDESYANESFYCESCQGVANNDAYDRDKFMAE